MDLYKLPAEYEQIKLSEFNQEKQKLEDAAQSKIDAANNTYKSKKKNFVESSIGDYFSFVCINNFLKVTLIGGPIFGIVLGTILCSEYDWYIAYLMGFAIGIGFMIIGRPIYGTILCGILLPIAYPIYKLICVAINKKADAYNANLKDALTKETDKANAELELATNELRAPLNQDIADYNEQFEKAAQKLSNNFARSSTTMDVVQWCTQLLIRNILGANRSTYNEEISIECKITVEANKVEFNDYDTYNFNEHRCEPLEDGLSQVALLKAICTQIQPTMLLQYEKDPSGTEYSIEVNYYYTNAEDDFDTKCIAAASLIYKAPNGNFKPLEKWGKEKTFKSSLE